MPLYLRCQTEGVFGRINYTIEIQKMDRRQENQCKLQVRVTRGHYGFVHDYDDNEWIETWSNVTRIRFAFIPFSQNEYGMQLFHTNEQTGTTDVINDDDKKFLYNRNCPDNYYSLLRINVYDIQKSARLHASPKYMDLNEWEFFNWRVREEDKDFICDSVPVKKLNPYISPAKVEEEEDEDKQSSETMTIQSLLRLPNQWTYYDVLKIPRDSVLQKIEKAYKKKALQWHPDKLKACLQKYPNMTLQIMTHIFKLIQEAYETLSDHEKRYQYDMLLDANQVDHHEKWNLDNLDSKFQNLYIVQTTY